MHRFKYLMESMYSIESIQLSLADQVEIVDRITSTLQEKYRSLLQRSVDKNPDLASLKSLPVEKKILFKWAPITTCEIERSFSVYRRILPEKRHKLSEDLCEMFFSNY